jgi:acyl dehydratase
MSLSYDDVEFGADLPEIQPDVTLANVRRFCEAAGMLAGRFISHDDARKEGLPQAIVPGIMSQGILTALVHRWAPGCEVRSVDTVFRAPVLVDSRPTAKGVVTDKDDGARTITLDLTVSNEAGETRVMGTAIVAFPG